MPQQFENQDNCAAHYETTGPEIWDDLQGNIDILIASVGTGGTITGTARYLKEKNPDLYVVAVEPANSAVLSGRPAGAHGIQGIGAGFIPKALDTSVYNEVIAVSDQAAFEATKNAVIDDGAGIPPEELPKIWQRFYRSDKSRSSGGLGLGLSLVKQIAGLHNARVTAESEPGKGRAGFGKNPLNF